MNWVSTKHELPVTNLPYTDIKGRPVEGIKTSKRVLVHTSDDLYAVATLNQDYNDEGEKEGKPYWFDVQCPENGDWINDIVTLWTLLTKSE